MSDKTTISERLARAGYSHSRSERPGYLHTITRTSDGAIIGHMDASDAVKFLRQVEKGQ